MENRHGFESQDDTDAAPLSNDFPAANNVLCEWGIQNHLHSHWYSGSPATYIFKGYTINYNNINNSLYWSNSCQQFQCPPWRMHGSLIL